MVAEGKDAELVVDVEVAVVVDVPVEAIAVEADEGARGMTRWHAAAPATAVGKVCTDRPRKSDAHASGAVNVATVS